MSEKLFDDLNTFLSLATDLIHDEKKKGIAEKIDPKNLLKRFDIALSNNGIEEEALIESLKDIIINTPKTSSNLFFNQLFGGLNNKAVLGDLLAVLLNNSMSTYKIAGVMVELEKEIIRQVCKLISYPENAGGTFPTGGSMSNFMGLIIARDKKYPSIRNEGISSKLICY